MPTSFSILTPSYNQASFLERNIASVRDQRHPGVQHIICDGGSSDGTVEILQKHSPDLAFWVSERDGGQTAALNKALSHASNDILGWLNVDEYYEPGIFAEVAALFDADPNLVLVYGDFNRVTSDGQLIRRNRQWRFDYDICRIQTPIVMNCAAFFRRSRVVECGGFNEEFHFIMDWEFYVRFMNGHTRAWKRLPKVLGNFTMHPASKTATDEAGFLQEIFKMRRRLFAGYSDEQIEAERQKQIRRMRWHMLLDGVIFGKIYFALVRRRHYDAYMGSVTPYRPILTPLLNWLDPLKSGEPSTANTTRSE